MNSPYHISELNNASSLPNADCSNIVDTNNMDFQTFENDRLDCF